MRTVLLAALLALGAAAPASAKTESKMVYVIDSRNSPDVTSIAKSVAGERYVVEVAGVYNYNSGNGLGDCGWYSRNGDPLGAWTSNTQFRVDGHRVDCGDFREDHVYTFEIVGTGRELVFDILDAGGSADNKGALVVTISPLT